MRRTYYHATAYENLIPIVENGIRKGCDGLVYLCEKEEDALKFLYVRGIKNVVTFKVNIRKPENIVETFDHSEAFFKCRCFGYVGDISASWVKPSKKYVL